ncbi:MAG: hypothetical protein ACKOFB_04490 [bacterium]
MFFDKVIFLYALYVAFAYAMLALGATYFRNTLDARERAEYALGETLCCIVNPLTYLLLGGVFIIFCIFALIALSLSTPTVLAYVFPLALFVNAVQVLYRASEQQAELCTRGVIMRPIFLGETVGIEYENLVRVEISSVMNWYKCQFYVLPFDNAGHCMMNEQQKNLMVSTLQGTSLCEVRFLSQ